MADVALPEVRLPEVHLPEGLRDMKREDIQRAVAERRVPKVDLSRVELPKAIEERLPKAIEERLPHRQRRNPLPMVLVLGGVIAFGAWLCLASPLAPRIRQAVDDARSRLGLGNGVDEADELLDDFEERMDDAMSAGGPTGGSGFEPDRGPVGVGPGYESTSIESASIESTGSSEGERPF